VLSVDRTRVPSPRVLQSAKAEAAYAAAGEHFAAEDSSSRQLRFKFAPLYRDAEVGTALSQLFARKCAFCESLLDAVAAASITHHFRPAQEAVDGDGGVSREHYWWLAYEWENLYLSCQRCATAAGAQFPVAAERARVGARGSELDGEKALLLDPCRDDPDAHLSFQADGSVQGLSERGKRTIATYALNRAPLVEARRHAIAMAAERPWRAEDAPYTGAIRQVLGSAGPAPRPPSRSLRKLLVSLNSVFSLSLFRLLRPRRRLPAQPVVVERLELRDFRGVQQLTLELAGPDDPAPWTMFLGENGHGKTSVLQALALLLMGKDARRRLRLEPEVLIRQGADAAEIVAHLRGAIEPRRLRIERDGVIETGDWDGPTVIAAYGAARIPPLRGVAEAGHDRDQPRVENLFDPASPLTGAERWLLGLDEESFDFAGRALRRLLLEPEETVVERLQGTVVLRTADGPKSLGQLSDGYRSMIALAADIMSFFMTRYGSMDAAEGVVLVDELSAHLHPRWQMRVVEAFREAFPRLQFVVTTHDPLCLRGLAHEREVIILRHTSAGEVYALPHGEVPPISGLRVDELLTSEVFGLSSTIDPELERDFDRYYALLASYDRDPETRREIDSLKQKLAAHRQFGTTRRERLALEAADEYLAREGDVAEPGARGELLDETKRRLRAIWAGEA
jgi:uncharacterized protein (TIGR02646 family)